jgi:CAAX prenyl protease-like protein
VVFEGTLATNSHFPVAWVVAWYATGALTLALWALAVLSFSTWSVLLRQCWKAVLLGSAIGGAAWYAGQLMDLLWPALGWSTLMTVKALLQLFFPDTIFEPGELVIGTEDFLVEIAPQCSGFEGMGLMVVFLAAFLWLYRGKLHFPAAFLLIPIGVAGAWFLNAVRITLLIALGSWGWREVALGGFHTQAGWLFFIALALGLVIFAGRCSWITRSSEGTRFHAPGDLTLAYLGPFLMVLAIAMLGKAFSSDFDWLYPLRVLGAGVVLFLCRHSYGELCGGCSWKSKLGNFVTSTSRPLWKLPRSWPWQGVCLGMVVFGLWLWLIPGDQVAENHWVAVQEHLPIGGAYLWMVFRVIGFVAVTPLVEELAFRGYMIRRLMTSEIQTIPPGKFSWPSMVISSGLFGALHRPWLPGMLAGLLFALALRSRGRLGDAILAHVTANVMLAATVLFTGQWDLWS